MASVKAGDCGHRLEGLSFGTFAALKRRCDERPVWAENYCVFARIFRGYRLVLFSVEKMASARRSIWCLGLLLGAARDLLCNSLSPTGIFSALMDS